MKNSGERKISLHQSIIDEYFINGFQGYKAVQSIKDNSVVAAKSMFNTIIKDKRFVTSNVSSILAKPGFIDYFLSAEDPTEPLFFDSQFNEYMFRGKNLYQYLIASQSECFAALMGLLNSETTVKDIEEVREIADELSVG